MASWSPPPTLVPSSQTPPCGLATSGSDYQPGRPDLIGTFQISEGEGELTGPKLTSQGLFLLVFLGYSSFSTFILLALFQFRHFFLFLGGGTVRLKNGVLGLDHEGKLHTRLERSCLPLHSCCKLPVCLSTPAHHRHPHFRPSSPALPPPQSLAATRSPPPHPSSLPTLAPLPAFYSSIRRPTLSAPRATPTRYSRFLEKCAPPWLSHSRRAGEGVGPGAAPAPGRSPCERR